MNLFQSSFYAAILFTILGCIMGLLGELILIDIILAGTSIIVAVITRFLS